MKEEVKNSFDVLSLKLIQDIKTDWNKVIYKATIYNDNCKFETKFGNDTEIKYFKLGFDNTFEINDITILLRDQILKETGRRIWGLTFTLYPDGKYEIEYDYNIPEGFNEKAEYIGEQDFGEVTEFFDNIRNIGTDEFELK
ncbi:MAG: hypothetical protein K8R39_01350 [Arcobacteraceae bacterium]|nr:hypothetical protein [Arcobacteraceae bacterium]